MDLFIYNTATRKKEKFVPIDSERVGMYLCGPTVYDRIHIGNARPLVVFDVLYRLLRYKYDDKVCYVRNITDVDDKINQRAIDENRSIDGITSANIKFFSATVWALNCLEPTHEPLATEHIAEMIEIIEILINKGHAYVADSVAGQHVFFEVKTMPNYGEFANISEKELLAGERIEQFAETHNFRLDDIKRNPQDFVLWKPSTEEVPGWDSPWGRGRPGWHIECSAMSRRYLGESFDLHLGGQDLIFPHHQNEIAQSCCAFPHASFAKYWMHNGYVMCEGKKMSKSLGNCYFVNELIDEYGGDTIRLLLLRSHYQHPMNFTKESVREAKVILEQVIEALFRYSRLLERGVNFNYSDFGQAPLMLEALSDDLNTPLAISNWLGYLHELNRSDKLEYYLALRTGVSMLGLHGIEEKVGKRLGYNNPYRTGMQKEKPLEQIIRARHLPDDRAVNIKARMEAHSERKNRVLKDKHNELNKAKENKDFVLADQIYRDLKIFSPKQKDIDEERVNYLRELEISKEIEKKIDERNKVKKDKNFARADEIRDDLKKKFNIELQDTPEGTIWKIRG